VLRWRSLGEGSFSPSAFARLDVQPLASSPGSHSLRDADLKRVENLRYVRVLTLALRGAIAEIQAHFYAGRACMGSNRFLLRGPNV